MLGIPLIVGVWANSLDSNLVFANHIIGCANNTEATLAEDATLAQVIARVDGKCVAIDNSGNGLDLCMTSCDALFTHDGGEM